ncbi:MAG: DNA polymerase III subunit delta [Myxococcota bacterium]
MIGILERIAEAERGTWQPVQFIIGPERFLAARAIDALRRACLSDDSLASLNEDRFQGHGLTAQSVTRAARTLPMMAPARFVLVRNVHAMDHREHEAMLPYLADPNPSTCLVCVGEKLEMNRKLGRALKQKKLLIEAKALRAAEVRKLLIAEAQKRGHKLSSSTAAVLVDTVGEDLSALDDALERLSLFVGTDREIDAAAITRCVTRVEGETIWALVDAVGARDMNRALRSVISLLEQREHPIKILAMVGRQFRMVGKAKYYRSEGASLVDAGTRAGAPPFKAEQLTRAAERFSSVDLRNALQVISDGDRLLKGSRVPGDMVLLDVVLQLVRPIGGRVKREHMLPSLARR